MIAGLETRTKLRVQESEHPDSIQKWPKHHETLYFDEENRFGRPFIGPLVG
jgi:hypothetical protein